MPKVIDESERRVPLNCLIKPATRELILTLRNGEAGGSQGDVVDYAVEVLASKAFGDHHVRPRKQTRKEKIVAELAASDLTAQKVGREDIDYANSETLPKGQHVTNLDATANPAGSSMGKATVQTERRSYDFRKNRGPLLKPKDRKK